jgi:DNA-directed RNA polymerase specialized sigma24 family protein
VSHEPANLPLTYLIRIDWKLSAVQKDVGELRRAKLEHPEKVEPPDENVAARVFDIVRKMELPPRNRKAPLVKVFQLYCMDGLSSFVIAKKCRCSRSLVMLRLNQIAKKIGCEPSRLRALANRSPESP